MRSTTQVDDLSAPVSYVGNGADKQFVAKFSFAGLKKSYIRSGDFGIMPNFDQKFGFFDWKTIDFLKEKTDYPVGKLDEFPLIYNKDVIVRADVFRMLEESGVGVPNYYKEIEKGLKKNLNKKAFEEI